MTQQNITIGAQDAGYGDTLFAAFTKIEANFTDLYNNKAALSHTHTASQVTDFQSAVNLNSNVISNTSNNHASTLSDSTIINSGTGTDFLADNGNYIFLGQINDSAESATSLWSSNKILSSRIITDVITVGAGEGIEYTDLSVALTAAGTAASPSNKISVQIYPGTYTDNFIIPDNVEIVGMGAGKGQVNLTASSGVTLTLPTGSDTNIRNLKISNTAVSSGKCIYVATGSTYTYKFNQCGIVYSAALGYSRMIDINSGFLELFDTTLKYTSTGDTSGTNTHEILFVDGTSSGFSMESCNIISVIEDSGDDDVKIFNINTSAIVNTVVAYSQFNITVANGIDLIGIDITAADTSESFFMTNVLEIHGDATSSTQTITVHDMNTNEFSIMSSSNVFRIYDVPIIYLANLDADCTLTSHYDSSNENGAVIGSGTYIKVNTIEPGFFGSDKIKVFDNLYFFKAETSLAPGESKANISALNNITGATGGELSILDVSLQEENSDVEVNAIKTTKGIKPIKQQLGEDIPLTALYISPDTPDSYTASTISFADSNPDTILDSANGLGNFDQYSIINVDSVSGANDGDYYLEGTVAIGTLTLEGNDSLSVESAVEAGEVILTETLQKRLTTFGSSFYNDDDYIYIGADSIFDIIVIDLSVNSSADIIPTFEFSEGSNVWGSFTPVDNTNGFTNSGLIVMSELSGWSTQSLHDGEVSKYYIRIQRTKNNLVTIPTINSLTTELSTTSSHEWDEYGLLKIKTFDQTVEPTSGDDPTSGEIGIGKYAFWSDDSDVVYLCYNYGGTIKKLTFT